MMMMMTPPCENESIEPTYERDFLYTNDCALAENTLEDAKEIVNCLTSLASRFGLSINIKKTEVIYQSLPKSSFSGDILQINNTPLVNVEKSCYLGSVYRGMPRSKRM